MTQSIPAPDAEQHRPCLVTSRHRPKLESPLLNVRRAFAIENLSRAIALLAAMPGSRIG